jgi:predicted amidophosphoribosyltransferase
LLVCEDDVCFECREKVVFRNVDFVMPLFSYRLWNKELMFMWKSMKVRCLSDFFAELIGEALIELGVKVVVPVPPRYGKIKEIGWDQVDELCNILEHRFGFKILRVLERKSVFQQKKLSRDERLESISEAYALRPFKKLKKILKPFHDHFPSSVWLLDDVCTTGATLEACAMNLKKAGIEKVNAITLFGVD